MTITMADNFRLYSRPRLAPWLAIAAVVVLVDQATKILISQSFSYGESYPVTSFFNLVLVHNPGAAFSFLASQDGWQRYFFTAVSVIASVVILYLLKKHGDKPLFSWAMAMILGGAVGNLIDRLVYGHVVDFLDFHAAGWHWPAFNIADCAIFIGAALYIIDEFRRGKR